MAARVQSCVCVLTMMTMMTVMAVMTVMMAIVFLMDVLVNWRMIDWLFLDVNTTIDGEFKCKQERKRFKRSVNKLR